MAYYNNTNNANLYPNFSTSDEFDGYPFLGQTSANEEAYTQTHTFPGGWTVGGQPDNVVSSPTSLRAEAGFELASSATQVAQTHGYGQPSFPGQYWSMTGPYTQPYCPGIMSRDNSFSGMAGSGASTVVPTPSGAPLGYWGDNRSGSSAGTFYANVQTPYQPRADSTSTGLMPTRRFQPYGMPNAHSNEHRNAEAGPSTLVPPPTAYLAPLTANPSGGLSEASADAELNQTVTEEDTTPTARTRRPRGTGETREWRIRSQRDARRLRAWAQEWKGLPKIPSHKQALDFALEAVKTVRVPVYPKPRLITGISKLTAQGKKGAEAERERRKGARGANEELSRYYLLPANQGAWGCPELLLKVLGDVVGLPKPPVKQSP